MTPRRRRPPPTATPASSTHVVTSLAEARMLADPLRLQLLEEFARAPRTTKQVATDLGLPPTRLYRHVNLLRDAGLLIDRGQRQKRGTTERYLQSVARSFEIRADVLQAIGPTPDPPSLVKTTLNRAASGFAGAVNRHVARASKSAGFEPLFAAATIALSRRAYDRLRTQLEAIIREAEATGRPGGTRRTVEVAVVAFPTE